MNEKKYKDVIGNNFTQNQMALAILLNEGKSRLLDDEVINKSLNEVENREPLPKGQIYLMTKDFQKDVIKIARGMAELTDIEIFRYIKNEVSVPKQEKAKNKGQER